MNGAQIHFIVGSTGAGKTTFAQALTRRENAITFSIDAWMQNLFAADLAGAMDFKQIVERTQRVRKQMWEVAAQALGLGLPVVFDTGLLTAADRSTERAKAEMLGVRQTTHYIEAARDIRWRRVAQRNERRDGAYMFAVTRPMFDFIETIWQEPRAEERARDDFKIVRSCEGDMRDPLSLPS